LTCEPFTRTDLGRAGARGWHAICLMRPRTTTSHRARGRG
jgi:hypothetical protein